MTSAIVLVDVDGVVADFTGRMLDVVLEETGRRHEVEDVDQWSIQLALGLPDEHWRNVVRRIEEPGFASNLRPYPGAVEAVRDIADRHHVFFVTSPWWSSTTWMHDRTDWLVKFFGKTQGRKVVHTSAKQLVVGDVMVEDKAATLAAWERADDAASWHGTRRAFLLDRPYNRHVSPSERHLERLHSLDELVERSKRRFFE